VSLPPGQTLADLYFKYAEKTEPPMIFHRWSLLGCLAASLGRQYYLPFADFRIFPNMYVMLIGDPGTRKSTAIKMGKRILSASGYDKFSAERTSKEKFLLDLEGIEEEDGVINTNKVMKNLFGEDFNTADPKEVFIVADEFNEFVGTGNLEFLSMLGALWDWDDQAAPFKQRLKTSRSVNIFQPTINILSGNTHAGFAEAFPPQALGQGFLSRILLVYGEASGKKFAFPEKPSDELKQALIDAFLEIKSNVMGEATLTQKARDMLQTIYHSFEGLEDARFKHYSTRRYTHLLKVCLLTAASACRTEIRAEDVLFANTLLTFTEHRMPNAMGEFGKARNADVAARLVSVLTDAKMPVDLPALWKQVSADLDKPEDLNKLLAGLIQAGKVQYVARTKSGNLQGYMIVRKMLSNKHVYCDFSLLKESNHV
jgi:hypothetical protein